MNTVNDSDSLQVVDTGVKLEVGQHNYTKYAVILHQSRS